MQSKLFSSFELGKLSLKNRIVMASMTRGRAENAGLVPTAAMATYYSQRATAGLILTEGTWVSEDGIGYINVPGIFSDEQVLGWIGVTDAVHAAGGLIFSQLAHLGAVSHPDHLKGKLPLGPSAINPQEQSYTPSGFKDTPIPREMTKQDILDTVADFKSAGKNAMRAGFDGVEIHAAHLYLAQEFLSTETNKRQDEYGGSPENRTRFLLQVVEALISVWGPKRVGVKLSPASSSGLLKPNADTVDTFRHLAKRLNDYALAYLHVWGPTGYVVGTPAEPFQDIAAFFRPLYKGTLIVAGSFTEETGEQVLKADKADLVAYASPFIANPDLVARYRDSLPLAVSNAELHYTGGLSGYTDYPSHVPAHALNGAGPGAAPVTSGRKAT
jgi:N-ethylmaleimide reductase